MSKITDNVICDYWFVLKPNIYVTSNAERILLYDMGRGLHLESEEKDCISFIQTVYESQNLGVGFLSRSMLTNDKFVFFVNRVIDLQMADIISADTNDKPASLLPVFNLKRNNTCSQSTNLIYYLTSLTLYINTDCSQKCKFCDLYCKQTTCCANKLSEGEMSLDFLKDIMRQTSASPLAKINIVGGNILEHKQFSSFVEVLKKANTSVHYWLNYKNIESANDDNLLKQMQHQNILVDFPIDEAKLEKVIKKSNQKAIYYFLVDEESQYQQVGAIADRFNNINYKTIPIYNNYNIDFFKKKVFLSKEDIFSAPISRNKISCNQSFNSNYYGSLYIFPDGTAKANPNAEKLGNLNANSIAELLRLEMERNTSWIKLRNNEPCNKCLYQYLCPPPSNYEIIIGKSNLCSLKTETMY